MAGVVQRLIRWIWGTIAAPASIENKQASFNEGDNGSGRDRTQMVAKGPTGTNHVFVTLDEIEDYVQQEIDDSTSATTSPFVVVTNSTEYVSAMESPIVQNVWCDDSSGEGIYIESNASDYDISVVSSKNVYGAGGYCLRLEDAATMTINVTYPSSDNGNEIKINYFDAIQFNGSSFTTGGILAFGGHSGNAHELNFENIEVSNDSINLRASDGETNMYGKIAYEICESELTEPLTTFGVDQAVNKLWSGKNTQLKTNSDNTITPVNTHTVTKEVGNFTSETKDSSQATTTATASSTRAYYWDDEAYAVQEVYRKNEFATDVNRPAASKWRMFKDQGTTLVDSFGFSGDGQSFIGEDGIDPWNPGINVSQIKYGTNYSYESGGSKYYGVAFGCYYDGSWWRRSELNLPVYIEEVVDGVKSIYRGDGGSVDSAITLENITPTNTYSTSSSVTDSAGTVVYSYTPQSKGVYQFILNFTLGFSGLGTNESAIFNIRQDGDIYAYCGGDQGDAAARNQTCSVVVTIDITDTANDIEFYLASRNGTVSITNAHFGVEYKGDY